MEETLSCIVRGCKLARDLESNLPNIAKRPRMLSAACDEITKNFRTAKERLDGDQADYSSLYAPHMFGQQQGGVGTSYLQALQSQYGGNTESKTDRIAIEHVTFSGHPDREGSARSPASGREFQSAVDRTDSGNSNSQRSRRRKDDTKKRTVTVAAPRIGNPDIPPDDNFTWRKYGQKEILGSKYPRSYYRCTHQKLYNCPAKKQVQRLGHDPLMFDITYLDDHTCHKSATAPSVPPPPPPPPELTSEVVQATAANLPMGRWLSMDLGLGEGSGSGRSTVAAAGPSTARFGRELEYPVVDLADTMFNSGSSSCISMDFLFTHMEDKWEQHPAGDHKKKY